MRGPRLRRLQRRRRDGQPNDEFAPPAETVAVRFNRAAMHGDKTLYQRQADAEPAHRALQRRIDLHEHVEDPGKLLRGDADAVVANADHGLTAVALDDQLDPPSVLRELASVVQQ